MKTPKPETRSALLMSEGNWKITPHKYVATREVVLPEPDGAAWEFLFKCSATGVTRRWGTCDREVVLPPVPSDPAPSTPSSPPASEGAP